MGFLPSYGRDSHTEPHVSRKRSENIFDVVRDGSPEELRALIAAGGKVDATWNDEETPLHRATSSVRVEQARVLLDHGAPIDALTKYGGSALFECASRLELLEMAALLLERGADPNRASRYNGAPLHASASHGNVALIELLVANGAAIDGRDQRGWTPLHVAAFQGRVDAVAALLRLGAQPNLVTPDGKTPLLLASNAKIRKLLPADPLAEAEARKVDAVFATLTELGWFKYVPINDVDDVRTRFRDAYLVEPTLIAPHEDDELRGIDGRSCAADTEEVAEGSAHEVFLLLRASLAQEGAVFSKVESARAGDGYELVMDGERYEVSSGFSDQAQALDRVLAIANRLLSRAGSSERLYSVGSGNDTSVILLSPALARYATTLDVSPPLNASA